MLSNYHSIETWAKSTIPIQSQNSEIKLVMDSIKKKCQQQKNKSPFIWIGWSPESERNRAKNWYDIKSWKILKSNYVSKYRERYFNIISYKHLIDKMSANSVSLNVHSWCRYAPWACVGAQIFDCLCLSRSQRMLSKHQHWIRFTRACVCVLMLCVMIETDVVRNRRAIIHLMLIPNTNIIYARALMYSPSRNY